MIEEEADPKDTRPEVTLDVVEDRPEWKVACGFGVMTRRGELFAVKILIPKKHVIPLQQQLAEGERPVVHVSRWQIRVSVPHAEDLFDC